MVSLTMNFLAFYLGAIYLERSGIFCGVSIFLLTALAGTIIASGLERFVIFQSCKALNICVDRIAGYSAERVYIGRRN